MKQIVKFINSYVNTTNALTDVSALITDDVTQFINAVQNRIVGLKNTNEIIASTGYRLTQHLQQQINTLYIIDDTLNLCVASLYASLNGVSTSSVFTGTGSNSDPAPLFTATKYGDGDPSVSSTPTVVVTSNPLPGAKSTILQLVQSFPQMQETLQALNLSGALGTTQTELNGLSQLMDGLQQVLQFNTGIGTQEAVERIMSRFSGELRDRLSVATVMSTFDEVPKQANSVAIQQRFQQITEALDALQNLVSNTFFDQSLTTPNPANIANVNYVAYDINAIAQTGDAGAAQAEAAALTTSANNATPFEESV
jgi:hypothetical protein